MRSILALIACIILVTDTLAQQDNPHEYAPFGIIDTSQNALEIYGGQDKLDNIFVKLSSLAIRGEGRINILHLGDSHIQADYFSGRLRDHFSKFIAGGEASRGFIFPYTTAGTNNPANYKVWSSGKWTACRNIQRKKECNLGLSGASVTTATPNARITITQPGGEYSVFGFDQIKVYHTFDPESFGIHLRNNAKIIDVTNYPEAGYTEFKLDRRQDSLLLEFAQENASQNFFELFGISLETSEDGITYSATGINGADVPAWLSCPQLGAHIASLNLDLIIVSLGTNDGYNTNFNETKFYAKFDTLLMRIESDAPQALVILTTPGDNYFHKTKLNENTVRTEYLLRELAKQHTCMVWDFYSAMGGANSIVLWQDKGLSANDRVHLTKKGYLLQGDMLFSAIIKEFDAYIERTSQH